MFLDISYNAIEFLSPRIHIFKDVDASGNPLDNIMPSFRGNKDKVGYIIVDCFYLFDLLILLNTRLCIFSDTKDKIQ